MVDRSCLVKSAEYETPIIKKVGWNRLNVAILMMNDGVGATASAATATACWLCNDQSPSTWVHAETGCPNAENHLFIHGQRARLIINSPGAL
jgi:hypothetical protein